MNFIVRWKYRFSSFMGGADAMNRRVKVEQYLFDCANGKKPLPDATKCRELALSLGTPSWGASHPVKLPPGKMLAFDWLYWAFVEAGMTREAEGMQFALMMFRQAQESTSWHGTRCREIELQRDELLKALMYLNQHKLWVNTHAKSVIESAMAKVGDDATALTENTAKANALGYKSAACLCCGNHDTKVCDACDA